MGKPMIKPDKAEQARQDARKGSGAVAQGWGAPTIEDSGNVLVGDPENTVLASVLSDTSKKLTLLVSSWPVVAPVGRQDTLTIYHIFGTPPIRDPIHSAGYSQSDSSKFPLKFELEKHSEAYGDGTHRFECVVQTYNGTPPFQSGELSLRLDRVAPSEGKVPAALPAIADVVDANVDTVALILPDYPDRASGDRVYYYWLDAVPDDPTLVTPAGDAVVTAANQSLPVPKSFIEAAGDGEFFAMYAQKDKAGNISQLSLPTSVSVALGAMPANLRAPVVPLAADNLIDREDAMQGVQVQIPQFDNWKPTDEVSATWEGLDLGQRPIGEGQAFPLVFNVALTVLRDAYGTPAEGEKDMVVRYEVWRGGKSRGNMEITVPVNFETFGPVDPGPDPDPDWPDPVNPRLPLCDVFGKGSTTANELLPAHDGEEATLEVLLYTGLLANDLVKCYWNGEHVVEADYPVKPGDAAGDKLTRPIPWPYIQRAGNVDVAVHYEVTRPSFPNKIKSRPQTVKVSAIVLRPDAPQFQGLTNGWLNCASLVDPAAPTDPWAVRVSVGDLTQYGLKTDDKVTMTWWILHGATGNTEVTDARCTQVITLGPLYDPKGFIWLVKPYDDYILPLYDFDKDDHSGRAFCTYEFEDPSQRDSGVYATVVSKSAENDIAMHDLNGSCPLPPPRS